jgi:thioredoxin 1
MSEFYMLHGKSVSLLLSLGMLLVIAISCSKSETEENTHGSHSLDSVKVTFIELGSVTCIPCKKMQPVMEKLKENFPKDVNVVFYDVWTEEHSIYAREFNIRMIPTQIFLDENGEEYYRHEGFFPYEQIVEILYRKGVKN